MRRQRFTRPLKSVGIKIDIPSKWSDLRSVQSDQHDTTFVHILEKHGLPVNSPIPLVARYSKPRPWSKEELEACVDAHCRKIPIALMSAALNRNPQDIIYRLLDACDASKTVFHEVGLGTGRWTPKIQTVAKDLFDAGLTAWRIGALFGVDFERIEKALYAGRADYGHVKRNPFAICTDHKQETNHAILAEVGPAPRVLDAFAGEGRFAAIVEDRFPKARQVCVEKDVDAYHRAQSLRAWAPTTRWILEDNIAVMKRLALLGERFNVIDLDPFVSCHEQIKFVWPLLDDRAYLFVTFGGEYRRSFIRTNRKAIQRRYGFYDSLLAHSDYLEIVPSFFLGWLAAQASAHAFIFEIERCVRYPNNCRFWLRAKREHPDVSTEWLNQHTRYEAGGVLWNDLHIPRFSELKRQQKLGQKKSNALLSRSSVKEQSPLRPEQMVFEI